MQSNQRKGSLLERAFFAFENVQHTTASTSQTDLPADLPTTMTDENSDSDFELPQPSSSSRCKSASTPRTALRDDRSSMMRPSSSSSKRVTAARNRSTARKLDYDESFSGTEDEGVSPACSVVVSEPERTDTRRASVGSTIAPVKKPDYSVRPPPAKSIKPRTPKRNPDLFNEIENDESEDDVPLAKLAKRKSSSRSRTKRRSTDTPKQLKRFSVGSVVTPVLNLEQSTTKRRSVFESSSEDPEQEQGKKRSVFDSDPDEPEERRTECRSVFDSQPVDNNDDLAHDVDDDFEDDLAQLSKPPRSNVVNLCDSPLPSRPWSSSRYSLPVRTPSPVVSRSKKSASAQPRKKRRIRRIADSDDDDDDDELNGINNARTTTPISKPREPIVVEPTQSRPVSAEPSESAKKLMEKHNADPEQGTKLEWFHERGIEDFSDHEEETRKQSRRTSADNSKSLKPSMNSIVVAGSSVRTPPRRKTKTRSLSTNCSPIVISPSTPKLDSFKRPRSTASLAVNKPPKRTRTLNLNSSPRNAVKKTNATRAQPRPESKDSDIIEINSDDDFDPPSFSRRRGAMSSSEDRICTVETDDGKPAPPPPFRLETMCNEGETVMQMYERLGEDVVLTKIAEAQNEGREVIGKELLGISFQPQASRSAVQRFRGAESSVSKRRRKAEYDPEKAMDGMMNETYEFNYSGKNKDYSNRGGKSKWRPGGWRGRGRGKAKGGGKGKR